MVVPLLVKLINFTEYFQFILGSGYANGLYLNWINTLEGKELYSSTH